MIARKRITLIFLLSVTALTLYLSYIIFRPFLYPLFSAVVIAIVFFPFHVRMCRLVRNPSIAALLTTILVTLIIVVPAIFIGVAITQEISDMYNLLDQRSDESGGLSPYLMQVLDRPLRWIGQYVDLSRFNLSSWLLARLQQFSSFLLTELGVVVGGVTSFIVNTVITLFTLFFLFREGRSIRRRAAAVLPLNPQQVEELFNGIGNTIIATVYGGIVVAAAQGALTGIALWICGIGSPVLWGLVAAAFSLVPLVGSAVVWAPASIYLIATGSYGYAIFLAIWGAGVVGTVDNFLRPMLISGRVKLHTLLIFFSVFGGVQVFGFLGLFVGPVILAITITLLGLLRQEATRWRSFWAALPDDTQELQPQEAQPAGFPSTDTVAIPPPDSREDSKED